MGEGKRKDLRQIKAHNVGKKKEQAREEKKNWCDRWETATRADGCQQLKHARF
jgi:hypothetical protein